VLDVHVLELAGRLKVEVRVVVRVAVLVVVGVDLATRLVRVRVGV
jgi:hypothetical protein